MSILERPGSTEVTRAPPATRRAPIGLLVALIVAVLAALTSTTLLLVEQYRSSAERDAINAVMDFVDALNTGERDALAEVTTDNVVWAAIADGDAAAGPERGGDYLDFQTAVSNFRIDARGDATVLGSQVSLPVHVDTGETSGEDGFLVVYLREVDDELLAAEIIWMPQ